MKLEAMTNEALDEELRKQRAVQGKNPEHSQMWIAAARIIHHVAGEQEKRRRRLEEVKP